MITTTQFLIFLAYNGYIASKYGILDSISESYYRLGMDKAILFWIFLISIGLLMMMQGGMLFTISGIGLWIVGTFEPFKHRWKAYGVAHYIGAYTAILSALIGLGVHRSTYIPLIAFLVVFGIIKLMKPRHETYWIEMNAFWWIILGLMFY